MWECVNCGEVLEDTFELCWRCGSTREGDQPVNFLDGVTDDAGTETRYDPDFSNIILSTTPDLKTHTIGKYLGVVSGEAILGADVLNDLAARITDIVGGRSGTYESYIQRARRMALQEMAVQAAEMSADAIIGIKFDYETIRGSMLMVTCSGTAVAAEDNTKQQP